MRAKRGLLGWLALGLATVVVFILLGRVLDRTPEIDPSPAWIASLDDHRIRREEVLVPHDGVFIATEFLIPQRAMPHDMPVVLFVPGSGNVLAQAYVPRFVETFVQRVFLTRGVIVGLVNKRGMGASTGSWLNGSIEERAGDVSAVVDMVRQWEFVDPDRIAVLGHSEGGRVAAQLAADRSDIALAVNMMGSVRPEREELVSQWATYYGCEERDRDELARVIRWEYGIYRLKTSLGRLIPIGRLGFSARLDEYDPLPAIMQDDVPVLHIWGGTDGFVDGKGNQQALLAAHGGTLPDNVFAVLAPNAGHRGYITGNACASLNGQVAPGFSLGVLTALESFIDNQGF